MQPQRGKPPTRGAYQIMKENAEMNSIYYNMSFYITIFRLIISALYTAGGIKPNFATQSVTNIIISHFSIPTMLLIINHIMKSISSPVYSNTPERRLIGPGYDLTLCGKWGQYFFNEITMIIVLTHILTVVSHIFWYLLLFLPIRGLYLFWRLFLRPILIIIFTDNETGDSERTKKKDKKSGKKKFKYRRTITHWHHFK